MRLQSSFRYLLLLTTAILVPACASSPATHFYILEPIAEPAKAPDAQASKRFIGLGPITLPVLLERKQLLTRSGANTVQLSELHRWAMPLKENIMQVLTENLALLLPKDRIKAYPWSAYGQADYRILVDIKRFDATLGQSANFEAEWAMIAETDRSILHNGSVKINRTVDDASYSGAVNALNHTLSEFSRQLADSVKDIR